MVIDWNLVGESWTAQYDKDMVLDELVRRFEECIQLREAAGTAAGEDLSSAGRTGGNMNASHQE